MNSMTRRLKQILWRCALLALAGVAWRRSLSGTHDLGPLLGITTITVATTGEHSGPQTSAEPCPCCGGTGACCRSGSGLGTCCYSAGTTGTLAISIILPDCTPQPPKFRYPNDDAMVGASGAGTDCGSPSNITMHRGTCPMRALQICSPIDSGDCFWTACFDWTDVSVADGTAGTPRTGCFWVVLRDVAGVKQWKWGLYSSSNGGTVDSLTTDWIVGSCLGFNFSGDDFGMICGDGGFGGSDAVHPATVCFNFSIDTDTNHCHHDPELDECIEELI